MIGVDYGHLGNRSVESVDGDRDVVVGEHPTDRQSTNIFAPLAEDAVQTNGCSDIYTRQNVTKRGIATRGRGGSLLGSPRSSYDVTGSHPRWHMFER